MISQHIICIKPDKIDEIQTLVTNFKLKLSISLTITHV